MKKKVLVVVAHPDDETIWMGGLLIKNRNNWNTTIISLCRKDDSDRAPKFKKVCQIYKAQSVMSDLEDETLDDIDLNDVIQRIKKNSNKNYDNIFTHGKNGEYGHKRHLDVNKAVIQMIKDKILSTKKICSFSYIKHENICYANKKSDKFIKLNNSELKLKKKIIREMYGFSENGFEDLCCQDVEAFKIKEVKYVTQKIKNS